MTASSPHISPELAEFIKAADRLVTYAPSHWIDQYLLAKSVLMQSTKPPQFDHTRLIPTDRP